MLSVIEKQNTVDKNTDLTTGCEVFNTKHLVFTCIIFFIRRFRTFLISDILIIKDKIDLFT